MDKSTGWCSHCKTHHVESCGADPFLHPAECPKLAQPITAGISLLMEMLVVTPSMVVMIIWQARESLKNSPQSSSPRHTLAMITDEAMTHLSKVYLFSP
jgi:hypothetical protein